MRPRKYYFNNINAEVCVLPPNPCIRVWKSISFGTMGRRWPLMQAKYNARVDLSIHDHKSQAEARPVRFRPKAGGRIAPQSSAKLLVVVA